MPIFDYQCSKCNHVEEHLVMGKYLSLPSDISMFHCSICNYPMIKLLSPPGGFFFKGDGFYKQGFNK
jgi:predicted nucleic acid-binding Zn ribbon protein